LTRKVLGDANSGLKGPVLTKENSRERWCCFWSLFRFGVSCSSAQDQKTTTGRYPTMGKSLVSDLRR